MAQCAQNPERECVCDARVQGLDEIQEQPGRRLRDIKYKVIVGVATSLGTALVIALLVLAVNNL